VEGGDVTGVGWLEDTPDGHRISKIDPWEAGAYDPPPTPRSAPMTAIEASRVLSDVIAAVAPSLAEETTRLEVARDTPGLGALLLPVRRARATLAFLESEAEGALARVMPGPVVAVDGVGVLERRSGSRRTDWDDARVASLLAARAADERFDRTTGEILPPALFAQHVVDELLACARPNWRVTALRARNIDPADFSEEKPGRPTVQIREAE
jgi:hypothetical protein